MFMLYGFGYYFGVDMYDVGGYGFLGIFVWSIEFGLKNCRIVFLMKEGNVMTIESGCYFIDVLFDRVFVDGFDIK